MSVSNAAFDFAVERVGLSLGALAGSLVTTDLYEPIGEFKTVRVGDIRRANFAPGIGGALVESNAILVIQFICKPQKQSTEYLKAARSVTVEMAKEFAALIFQNSGLNDAAAQIPRVCDCQIEVYYGDQKKDISTAKVPAAYIQLKINAR